ncbi:uncharacterized protein NP_0970A [Natronomonas pharaonis DSM 2160]|uniref:Uncharacterized protein n=1 Tax=Natronomonas pharaonis (strain ATCC 35678 / DSM 2160 / CIP 103997 / JCM 8858 / NBRC 14720 / NCIMB 2260 / Gabara) TaxID=348780 RepID=A0A1U7EUE2_NATPD|nr:hypothetical protein [Natronomonas pharaonis]CAI48576.1 uncharacterized protein NP_0970A [Natronomonas pharaonis DSM 2160]
MTTAQTGLVVALTAVLLATVAGAGVVAADDDADALAVDVEQPDDVVLTVTDDGDAVENATVTVSIAEDNETDTSNVTYDETGTHTTDANGTVSLSPPESTVDVTVAATDDDRTTTTEATLTAAADDEAFGQQVSAFVHQLLHGDETNATVGQQVSDFVTDHNPGNASTGGPWGPPAHAGPDSERPGHAGPGGDAERPGADAPRGPGSTDRHEQAGGPATDAPDQNSTDDRRGPADGDRSGQATDGDDDEETTTPERGSGSGSGGNSGSGPGR